MTFHSFHLPDSLWEDSDTGILLIGWNVSLVRYKPMHHVLSIWWNVLAHPCVQLNVGGSWQLGSWSAAAMLLHIFPHILGHYWAHMVIS